MAWSHYQLDIFEYAENPDNGSFVVSAVAGAGKTTTAVECARRIAMKHPQLKILFLSFNRSIAEELSERLKEDFPGIRCATLHSYGLSVLYKSKLKLSVVQNKWKNYIKKNIYTLLTEPLQEKLEWLYVKNCEELLRLCQINLIKPGDVAGVTDIMTRHNIIPVQNENEAVARLLRKAEMLMTFRSPKGIEIDYTDMITLPLLESFRQHIQKYDVVFIDEAQDLSMAQQELMLQCVKPDGKFIAIGDERQAINGFAGAMNDSFERLYKIAGMKLPLSVNYRCGVNILNEAQKIVPEIQPREDAPDGSVTRVKDLSQVQPGDMIICRKTAPLINIALKLMSEGQSAFVKGREMFDKLIALVEKVSDSGSGSGLELNTLYTRLDAEIEQTVQRLVEQGIQYVKFHPVYLDTVDKVNALKIIGKNCDNPAQLHELLDKLFDDKEHGDAVMLSTVHKAKGLEADRVFIICPELLPFTFTGQQPWELAQEMNLKYVAITRAKNELYWVDVSEEAIEDVKVK